jgi:hypothetical protein
VIVVDAPGHRARIEVIVKRGTLLSQLIDNMTPDVSRGAGDEDAVH